MPTSLTEHIYERVCKYEARRIRGVALINANIEIAFGVCNAQGATLVDDHAAIAIVKLVKRNSIFEPSNERARISACRTMKLGGLVLALAHVARLSILPIWSGFNCDLVVNALAEKLALKKRATSRNVRRNAGDRLRTSYVPESSG